jgi:osmotically-inducible protein OsmY
MTDERRDDRSEEQPGLVVGPTRGAPDVGLEPARRVSHGLRDDREIADDVVRRLGQHGSLDASGLEVRVDNGEVTLQGRVKDEPARHVAELIADAVPGVRVVVNRLDIAHG